MDQPDGATVETWHPCPGRCGSDVLVIQAKFGTRLFPPDPQPPLCRDCEEREREADRRTRRRLAAEASERIQNQRRADLPRLLDEAGASPWEHGHCTLDNFDTSECGAGPLEAARDFMATVRAVGPYDPVEGLYLAGPTGTGKSHLATAVLRELLLDPEIDPSTLVYDVADVLVSRIRSMYGGKGDVDGLLRRRERARVWIMDDLGREPPHPDVVGHLTMLIAQRARKGTLITGNLSPEEYETRHEDLARIGSRLGPAYFRTVKVEGRDRRFDESAHAESRVPHVGLPGEAQTEGER